MKSVHYLLVVLLPVILNAADGKEFRMQLVDRDGTVHELKNQEDYLQVPAQHLQMAAMVRHRRVHTVAKQKDLGSIEAAELSVAIAELESENSKEYHEWSKNNDMKICCCGVVCPMLLPMAAIASLTYGALTASGFVDDEETKYNISGVVGAALGGACALPLVVKIKTYITPDQSEQMNQIQRLQDELESRKNK
jgi:hypothetical protein